MLKKYGQLFLSLLYLTDTLVIFFSWILSYYIRFDLEVAPVTLGVPSFDQYLIAVIPILVIFLFNIKVCDLYEPLRGRSSLTEFYNIIKVTSLSILMIAALSFFYRGESYSRLVVLIFWGVSTVMMIGSHLFVRRLILQIRKKGYYLNKVLVVGAGELGQRVAHTIDLHPEIGFSVAGYLSTHKDKVGKTFGEHKVLGLVQDISEYIKEHKVTQIFVALPLWAHERLEQTLENMGTETVDIKVVPDLLKYMNMNAGVDDFDGLPIVNLTGSPLYGWNLVIKRTVDFLISSFAILITSPIMLGIAILIKLESRGPVLFCQERMGLDGKIFSMMKFRSMHQDAEVQTGPVWAQPNDVRCTRIGSILRRYSLDELPQLFNVFKGDMSLVGPRPERPVFVEDFKKSIPRYMLRLKMKAGITGWAQVNGWRGNTCLQTRIDHDIYYIKNWSLFFDIRIMIMTLWRGFINRHAY